MLWPLWQVETTASFYDERAYEVVDRFLVRAVSEAGLCRVDELAAFYGIPAALVQRCLRFLTTIGHVDQDGETVSLTALGQRSAQAGIRYEPKESRQEILIEQFTGQPLPRRYYEGSVPVFTSTEVPEDRLADRSRFMPLFAAAVFRPELVERLAERSDRAELNVPQHLRDLRVVGERPAFIPVYLIETAGRDLLVYTALAAERDAFFEAACRQAPAIGHMISAEEKADPLQIWTEWLAESEAGPGTLRQLPNQVWRATLRADVFGPGGRLPLARLGSYELRRRHFLQLWCQDAGPAPQRRDGTRARHDLVLRRHQPGRSAKAHRRARPAARDSRAERGRPAPIRHPTPPARKCRAHGRAGISDRGGADASRLTRWRGSRPGRQPGSQHTPR